MPLDEINGRYGKYLDSMTLAFQNHLKDIIAKAQAKVISKLQRDLKITDGVLDSVPSNLRLLRQFDDIFAQAMDDAGYQQLIEAFVSRFPGQLRFMQEIISDLNDSIKRKLIPEKVTAATRDILNSFQVNATQVLESLVTRAAQITMNRTLFAVAGMEFGDLVSHIAKTFDRSLAESTTLANTSMSTFMRVAIKGQFEAAQKGQDEPLRYEYSGPVDLLIRPFCAEMMRESKSGKSWTMDEIQQMDNGTGLPVATTNGGWNCRHLWNISIDALQSSEQQAA